MAHATEANESILFTIKYVCIGYINHRHAYINISHCHLNVGM